MSGAARRPPPELARILFGGDRVLLVSHVPPDGDGLGAGLALVRALRKRGKEAVFAAGGEVQRCLRFLARPGEMDTSPSGPPGPFDVAVSLDSASQERLGELGSLCRRSRHFLNIDHHAGNRRFADLNWVDGASPAVGEMVVRLLEDTGIPLTRETAVPLYVALVTDTGRFSYSNTGPAAHRTAAALLATGFDPSEITDRLYRSIPEPFLRLTGLAIGALRRDAGGLVAHVTLTPEMLRESGADPLDAGDVVTIPVSLEGVEVGVLFRPAPDGGGTKVSLRSRRWFSVSDLAARWGGGGHERAAGATLPHPRDRARATVLRALREALEAGEGEPS